MDNKIRSQIKISPDSIKEYYENNKALFYTKPETRLGSILVDDSLLAHSIKKLLTGGDQFDNLAKKYSVQKLAAKKKEEISDTLLKRNSAVLVKKFFHLRSENGRDRFLNTANLFS